MIDICFMSKIWVYPHFSHIYELFILDFTSSIPLWISFIGHLVRILRVCRQITLKIALLLGFLSTMTTPCTNILRSHGLPSLLVHKDLFYSEWMQRSSDQHMSSRWAQSLSERIRGAPHLRQQRFIAKPGGGVRTGISLDQHVLMLKLKWIFLQLYNHPIELIWWRNWDKPWIASNVGWNPLLN